MQKKAMLIAGVTALLLAPGVVLAMQPTDATKASPPVSTPEAGTPSTVTPTATPSVAVGATVKDTKGAPVGKIAAVDGGYATLTTATNASVRMPLTSFGQQDGGLVIAMSAAEVDAAAKAASPGI